MSESARGVLDPRLGPVPTGLFLGGEFVDAASGQQLAVLDPATDQMIARISWGGAADAERALRLCARAQPEWSATPAPERGRLVRNLYDLVLESREWLAAIITAEQGKPLAEARGEVDYAAGFLRWAAEESHRLRGETVPSADPSKRILVLRQGVGVTAAVTPWNFPIAMLTRKLGPALGAGCTQLVKPARETPLTALALCRLIQQAGIPAGVVNLVTGPAGEVVGRWMADPALRKLSFTGSTEVGQQLIAQSAAQVVRLSLELGGHAPVLVFDDVDVAAAAIEAVRGKFRNTGQSCIAPNRFYVHADIYEEFVDRFAKASAELIVGVGETPGVSVGPLINDAAVEKARAHVADALERGARLVCGGDTVQLGAGFTDRFFAPTVLADVDHSMLITREETFAPIAPIIKFTGEAEVIAAANDTPFGLAAYFFTDDIGRAFRVAEGLDYGVIGLNDCLPSTSQAPFGGVKHSGYGREGGHYVMHEYLETKYLSMGSISS
jgi:succinate-semialdehyde dehydrogenase / glutarate-semialdehyde dehydrogenase